MWTQSVLPRPIAAVEQSVHAFIAHAFNTSLEIDVKLRRAYSLSCMLLILATSAGTTAGQTPAKPEAVVTDDAPRSAPKNPLSSLPDPLDEIKANVTDLEQAGYFKISAPRFAMVDSGLYEAIVWDVRAARPVTYRHVMMQLEKFRDARFFRTTDDGVKEVFATLLYYSPRIERRADNGELLDEDDVFEMWIYLNPKDVRKIQGLQADSFVLSKKRS